MKTKFQDLPIGTTFKNKHGFTLRKLPDFKGAGRAEFLSVPDRADLVGKTCVIARTTLTLPA